MAGLKLIKRLFGCEKEMSEEYDSILQELADAIREESGIFTKEEELALSKETKFGTKASAAFDKLVAFHKKAMAQYW